MQHHEEISNQQEENTAREYCFNRKIVRPKTNVKMALKLLAALELLVIALTFGTNYLLCWLDISFSFSTLYSMISFIVFCVCLKKCCVLSIKLYQHYASETTRRRCTLMPTCSEYALLALQKYNVFKALYKIFIRLIYKCKGIYQIDYP